MKTGTLKFASAAAWVLPALAPAAPSWAQDGVHSRRQAGPTALSVPPVVDQARRGTIVWSAPAEGTIEPEELYRLKSTIDGRMESVLVGSGSWVASGRLLGILADDRLAALIDARGTTPDDILQERWQQMYSPTKVLCPGDCFVVKTFAREKKTVQENEVLFQVAKKLRMVGRVRPQDAPSIKRGMRVEAWPQGKPERKIVTTVQEFFLDPQDGSERPGGTFKTLLNPKAYLEAGARWEGRIIIGFKDDAVTVPTRALLRYEDGLYLPVRVQTGIVTETETEITSGVEDSSQFLVLNAADLHGAEVPNAESLRSRPAEAPARRGAAKSGKPSKLEKPREELEPEYSDTPSGDLGNE